MNSSPTRRLTRRAFHKAAASSVAALAVPGFLRARGANDKLNIAIIGSGGRGGANLNGVATENIVALCDVDAKAVDEAAAKHPTRPSSPTSASCSTSPPASTPSSSAPASTPTPSPRCSPCRTASTSTARSR